MDGDNTSGHPSVCVLLAAFNGAGFIKEQLDSILSQRGVRLEIFISIDESSDSTEYICDQYM